MTRTALYRHYDDEGQLLYVGISENVESRTRMHVRRFAARVRHEWVA